MQERAVIISEKAFKLFGQTISQSVSTFATREFATVATVSTVATGALVATAVAWAFDGIDVSSIAGITAWTIVSEFVATTPGVIVGAAVGAVGVAIGADRATVGAVGAAAGALGTVGTIVGYFEVTASAVGAAAGAIAVNAVYREQEMNPVIV